MLVAVIQMVATVLWAIVAKVVPGARRPAAHWSGYAALSAFTWTSLALELRSPPLVSVLAGLFATLTLQRGIWIFVGRPPTYRMAIAALSAIVFVGVVAVPKRVEISVNFGVIAALFLAMAFDLYRYAKHERRTSWPILLALPLIAGCVGFGSRAIRVVVSADAMTAMVNDSALNVSTALGYVVLVLALHATLMALVIGRLVGELAALSRYDVLTGLLNRRAIQEELDAQVRRSKRDNEAFSALMIDVDRFKAINDRHGHPVGDLALKHVAELLRIDLREVDRIGRFGGEEFLVMLPGASGEHAQAVAERVRAAVRERALEHSGGKIPITISIGIAQWQSDDASQLLVRADAALYEAKRAGRDRVVLASQSR